MNEPLPEQDLVISRLEWDTFVEIVAADGTCRFPSGVVGQLMLDHLVARGWVCAGEGGIVLTRAGQRVAGTQVRSVGPGGVAIPRSAWE